MDFSHFSLIWCAQLRFNVFDHFFYKSWAQTNRPWPRQAETVVEVKLQVPFQTSHSTRRFSNAFWSVPYKDAFAECPSCARQTKLSIYPPLCRRRADSHNASCQGQPVLLWRRPLDLLWSLLGILAAAAQLHYDTTSSRKLPNNMAPFNTSHLLFETEATTAGFTEFDVESKRVGCFQRT